MSKWSGSDFAGPTENNWPQGVGKFKFPNNVVYEGNFDKGEFHGDGTLHYPNGVSITAWKWDKIQPYFGWSIIWNVRKFSEP